MRELFILIAHLLVTLTRLARPGGLGCPAGMFHSAYGRDRMVADQDY
jgi:hypothetical protein